MVMPFFVRCSVICALLLVGCAATRAVPIHRPLPLDSELAEAAGEAPAGTAYEFSTSYCIESDGTISQIVTEQSTGNPRIDDVYRRTIASWRFEPARVGGRPDSDCRTGRFKYFHRPELSPETNCARLVAGSGETSSDHLSLDEVHAGLCVPKEHARRRCALLAPNGGKAYIRIEIAGATGQIVAAHPTEENADVALARCVIDVVRAEARFRRFTAEKEHLNFSVTF